METNGVDLLLAEFLVERNLALATEINMHDGALGSREEQATIVGTASIHACVLRPISIPLVKAITESALEAGIVVICRKNLIKLLRLNIEQANGSIIRSADKGGTSTVPLEVSDDAVVRLEQMDSVGVIGLFTNLINVP